MQDVEFTIQQGQLYMLQTRTGKRTGHAALQIAVDMAQEGRSAWRTERDTKKPRRPGLRYETDFEHMFLALCFRLCGGPGIDKVANRKERPRRLWGFAG